MSEVPKPDPTCAVCGNAYGTRKICSGCRADPANDGWREGSEEARPVPVGARLVEWDGPAWRPSEKFRRVARLLLDPALSLRAVARLAGVSRSYVDHVLGELTA